MRRLLLIVAPVALIGGLIGWRLRVNSAEAGRQAQAQQARGRSAPAVDTARATRRDIVRRLEAVGNVESPQSVRVAPKVSGRIAFLTVREGDRVRQGQVLVRLDATETEGDVSRERADLAQARQRLAQALLTQNASDVSVNVQVRQQTAAVAAAEADQRQATESGASEIAAAEAAVTEMEGRVTNADSSIENAEAAVRVAKANLENAQVKLTRAERLLTRGFVSAQALDDARTAVKVQQSLVAASESALNGARAQHRSAQAQLDAAQRRLAIAKSQAAAEIEIAVARLAQAKAAQELARANTAQSPAYRANIAALRAAVTAAQGAVHSAEARRAETVLRSPIAGYVTARTMDPGAMATPASPILVVEDVNTLWVTIPAPEDAALSLRQGAPAEVRFDAAPGRTLAGRVTHVNAAADPASRQFLVRIGIDNRAGVAKPGMFARVSLVLSRAQAVLAVPREAVHRGREGSTVTVVGDDMAAENRRVVTGIEDPRWIEIRSGISDGDRVVTMSASPLKDGSKVRPGGAPESRAQNGSSTSRSSSTSRAR